MHGSESFRMDRNVSAFDLESLARALGGEVCAGQILAPGPGHSARDRSLSIKLELAAPDGFIVHSFAGDSPLECRDHVKAALGLETRQRRRGQLSPRWLPSLAVARGEVADRRSAFALQLWEESRDPRGTVVEAYLASRSLTLLEDVSGAVIRFHPALKFDCVKVGAMVSLFRDIKSDEPCGILRTFLNSEGRKLGRKMLGRARSAAIKLDADEEVTLGLTVGEGVETCLAAWSAGFRPVWALGSASAIAKFPVLAGIEAITMLGEVDDGGANRRAVQACATQWIEAGPEAFVAEPMVGRDLNDVLREVEP